MAVNRVRFPAWNFRQNVHILFSNWETDFGRRDLLIFLKNVEPNHQYFKIQLDLSGRCYEQISPWTLFVRIQRKLKKSSSTTLLRIGKRGSELLKANCIFVWDEFRNLLFSRIRENSVVPQLRFQYSLFPEGNLGHNRSHTFNAVQIHNKMLQLNAKTQTSNKIFKALKSRSTLEGKLLWKIQK